jgi:hypothetical protein
VVFQDVSVVQHHIGMPRYPSPSQSDHLRTLLAKLRGELLVTTTKAVLGNPSSEQVTLLPGKLGQELGFGLVDHPVTNDCAGAGTYPEGQASKQEGDKT